VLKNSSTPRVEVPLDDTNLFDEPDDEVSTDEPEGELTVASAEDTDGMGDESDIKSDEAVLEARAAKA
jgi:transcription termination factor Rho